MTTTDMIMTAIHDDYATRYPLHDPAIERATIDAMNTHIADAIIATASILADAIRFSSDSMIDTANATTSIITELNRIAYCDDFTLEPHIALHNFINDDFILDLFNMNCDDSALRESAFFAPIFERESELMKLHYPDL